ncbi:MAG TPA: DedA family protein [Chthoniobacterales bacterium]|jgi:membrane protein DedA with SNARE-associated domain|nr:DedA family protein [Chthoniobacterales bacterium]
MHELLQHWSEWVLTGGYLGIVVLMAMGSTPIPLPAEVVVPPAAFLAAQGRLSLTGVILASTLGAYLGAAVMYWLSLWLGRPLVVKFGRFILFPPKKLVEAEHWLVRYQAGGIFFARMLPGVRHLISIPAGIVRMNFTIFSIWTLLGSAISCSVLAYLGVRAQRVAPNLLNDPEGLVHFVRGQSKWLLLVVLGFALLYLLSMWLSKRKSR